MMKRATKCWCRVMNNILRSNAKFNGIVYYGLLQQGPSCYFICIHFIDFSIKILTLKFGMATKGYKYDSITWIFIIGKMNQ